MGCGARLERGWEGECEGEEGGEDCESGLHGGYRSLEFGCCGSEYRISFWEWELEFEDGLRSCLLMRDTVRRER